VATAVALGDETSVHPIRANGPHVTRMLATGRFPALAKAVHEATHVDAEASFEAGLDWVLDAVAGRLGRS
jgi:hypothetical protein